MPGMAMEELYGGQYRFNERAYNNYVNLTETLIEALSKDATNKTAYYAGRCTGDVVITVVGGVEFVYGLITTISGGSGSAAALATGIGIAAEPVTIAVTAEGVVTVVDGVNTIHYGITAFKKDADKGKEAKEADSKAAESGSGSSISEFDAWLNKGASDNKVYFGIKNGEAQYTGITRQTLNARLSQHNASGKGFQRLEEQFSGLTRNQARAIEQYYIENGPNNLNKINSISSNHRFYQEAINWAKQYLGVD